MLQDLKRIPVTATWPIKSTVKPKKPITAQIPKKRASMDKFEKSEMTKIDITKY